jgi:glycosyltransferase involved in cell wall biosynthesis
MNKKNICIVVSVSGFIKNFMLEDLKQLSRYFNITIISNDKTNFARDYNLNCIHKQIRIIRKISLIQDMKSLFALFFYFKKQKFDVVLSVTPKAGLLAMLASFLIKTPKKIHFFTGQVWVNKTGIRLFLLKNIDKLVAKLTTNILVAGDSQRDFLINQKIINRDKSQAVYHGVDLNKFYTDSDVKNKFLKKYNIKSDNVVFMFLGRINKDKGFIELISVMKYLLRSHKKLLFFIAGSNEDIDRRLFESFINLTNVFYLGEVKNPEKILNLADVVVLPSHREGCNQASMEAAALKIPTIAANIYGVKDLIINNKTGLLHEVANKNDMKNKYKQLIVSKDKREELGVSAYNYVVGNFDKKHTSDAFVQYFLNL